MLPALIDLKASLVKQIDDWQQFDEVCLKLEQNELKGVDFLQKVMFFKELEQEISKKLYKMMLN